MYPYMDEYAASDLFESNIHMDSGGKAKFYSAARTDVVMKHFEWMRIYGITGVFHMRFLSNHDDQRREWRTMVLRNVRTASETHGRAFAVSYNLAGKNLSDDVLDLLKMDWMNLVDEEKITSSTQYLHHEGRSSKENLPVLRIYGIGFKAVNISDTAKLAALIDWFQYSGGKYRVFLIGGVPSNWRNRIKDSRKEIEWRHIYESLDGINPWHVGRWTSTKNFEQYYHDTIEQDAAACKELGILYMPVMWPGFSWHNLKNKTIPINSIPRDGGRFMWAQAYRYAADRNIISIWMAQFDEVDEGTAIFKVAKDQSEVPDSGDWLTLDADGYDLPHDWYLRLCGEAQKMLAGETVLSNTIPIVPYDSSSDGAYVQLV